MAFSIAPYAKAITAFVTSAGSTSIISGPKCGGGNGNGNGVVVPDSVNRTLYVKRPEAESGYGLLLWRESHMALMRAQETGWRNGHQTVWAGVAGDSRVTNAVAVPNLKLMFLFPPDAAGKDAYRQLVGAPNLVASVRMDRESCRFLGVTFSKRP